MTKGSELTRLQNFRRNSGALGDENAVRLVGRVKRKGYIQAAAGSFARAKAPALDNPLGSTGQRIERQDADNVSWLPKNDLHRTGSLKQSRLRQVRRASPAKRLTLFSQGNSERKVRLDKEGACL
jgi:hypothetical protein